MIVKCSSSAEERIPLTFLKTNSIISIVNLPCLAGVQRFQLVTSPSISTHRADYSTGQLTPLAWPGWDAVDPELTLRAVDLAKMRYSYYTVLVLYLVGRQELGRRP